MCGIAGIFAYRESAPPVDEQELLRIREAMIKRGPDGGRLASGERYKGFDEIIDALPALAKRVPHQ